MRTKRAQRAQKSPFDRTRPLSRRSLVKFEERVLLYYTPDHLRAAMDALLDQARLGNMAAVKTILQMHNLVPAPGQITLTTNIQNNLSSAGSGGQLGWSFDNIVRRLDETSRQMTIGSAPELVAAEPPSEEDA